MQNANLPVVEVRNWQGASHQDLVQFLLRKTRIQLLNSYVDGDAVKAQVASVQQAEQLKKWSGVKFAGGSLRIEVVTAETKSTIEVLKKVVRKRYNSELALLDLTSLATDPDIVANGMHTTGNTSTKFFQALIKLANLENLPVKSLNLSGNALQDLAPVSTVSTMFPALVNLSLANNNISKTKSFEVWHKKLRHLRELIIANNPVCSVPNYQLEIARHFPKLVVLDGIVVRDELKLKQIYSLPLTKKHIFSENDQIHSIASQFILNFLQGWDSARNDLLKLYTANSQFSISIDSSIPSSSTDASFGYYLPISRNFTRVSSDRIRNTRLGVGPEQIAKLFANLPKSKHALSENPQLFAMQSWNLPELNGILISVHGEFTEVEKPTVDLTKSSRVKYGTTAKLQKKSFDRLITIVQNNMDFIIASDLLSVRPYAQHQWEETAGPAQAPAQPQAQPQAQQPAPQAQQQPELSPTQQQFLTNLSQETKLNLQFSLLLAQQSNWDYPTAINFFKTSHQNGQIPPEAFV